jgi:hypothetical protein
MPASGKEKDDRFYALIYRWLKEKMLSVLSMA